MNDRLPKIKFSNWCAWKDRNSLNNIEYPGVYILAKFKSGLSKKVDLKDKGIIYIGETCDSLKKRLSKFNGAAFNSGEKHSGGVSYRKEFNDNGDGLYVAIFPIANLSNSIRHLYIRYVERKTILDYALKNGSQPKLNKQ